MKSTKQLSYEPPYDYKQEHERRYLEQDMRENPKAYDNNYMLVHDAESSEEEGTPVQKYVRKDSPEGKQAI